MSQNKSLIKNLGVEDVFNEGRNSFRLFAIDLEEGVNVFRRKLALDIPSPEIHVFHLDNLDKAKLLEFEDALAEKWCREKECHCIIHPFFAQ